MKSRQLKQLLVLIPIMALIFSACGPKFCIVENPAYKGTINVMELDDAGVTLHSYLAPGNGGMVTTQIIESKTKLVLVDSQFMVPYAKEVRAYADSLNKPIDRIIITHAHPDHFSGLAVAFEDVPSYALAGTRNFIKNVGPKIIAANQKKFGAMAPDKALTSTNVIKPGTETIDGVKYEFVRIEAGEAGEQLLIKLPELQTMVAQDLVYNNVHLFIGNNSIDGWISILEKLDAEDGYCVVLAGHGEPTSTCAYAENIEYLKEAKAILATVDNGKDMKAKIMEKYPKYGGESLLDVSARFLFKKK